MKLDPIDDSKETPFGMLPVHRVVSMMGLCYREMQRRRMELYPQDVSGTTRALMAQGLGGTAELPQDAVAYMREHMSFDGNQDAAYVAMILASLWNRLENRQFDAAQALTGAALAAVDQWGRSGRMERASERSGRSGCKQADGPSGRSG